LSVEEVNDAFHARFSARAKTYRYRIRNTAIADPFERAFEWHIPEPLNVAAMRAAAASVVGAHDFAAFQSAGSHANGTIRTVMRSELSDTDGLLTYEVTGDGFLRHMVRAIVGTLVEIGRGWREAENMTVLLRGALRAEAGATAPPNGLFLVRVDYH
jgi:tRNA pseudouridine38-40 synthase